MGTRRTPRSLSIERPWFQRYAIGLGILVVAVGAALLLRPVLAGAAFLPFSAAVVIAAWLAGLGPALLVTVLSVAAAEYLLLPPADSFELYRAVDLLALALLVVIAVLVSWLGASARRLVVALQERGRELERYGEELDARRAEAEWHLERSRFLSQATMSLTASLDYEESLRVLARLTVPQLADYCVTYTLGEGGEVRRVAVAHADPDQEPLIERLLELDPPTLEDSYGAGAVLRTGEPILAREIPPKLLEQAVQGPEHLEVIRALGPISSLIVPLRARGHQVGAVAFATTEHSGRRYEERDLTVAIELAAHAGLAVDNARLFRRSQAEIAERERVQEQLERREAQLVALLDHAPDIIARFDRRFRYVYVNPAVKEIAGVSPRALIGRTNWEVGVEPAVVEEWEAALSRVFRTGEGHAAEFRLPLRGGDRWLHARLVPEPGLDGSVFTVLCIARDLTERKATELRRELLVEAARILTSSLDYGTTLRNLARMTARTVADLCVVDLVDEDGAVKRVETAASDPELEERLEALQRRFPTDSSDADHPVTRVLRTGEPVFIPDVPSTLMEEVARDPEHLRSMRELDPRSLIVVPLAGRGRTAGALTVVRIGGSRAYRQEDLALMEDLALHAGLALDNARLYRELEEAVRLREEMMAVVAHDLRDPLGVIASVASGLKRATDREERERLLALLGRQADRAGQLIRDLLDVSRIEAGRFSVQPGTVPAAELIEEACENARLKGREQGVSLEWRDGSLDTSLEADRSRVLQVLSNLLDNAVKAAPRGGRVSVRAEEEGEVVRFSVSDDGPGIPASEIPKLFDRFWQGRRRSDGAAGLGLAIVKGIVEAHGGRVWVESREGRGTTFFFTVPKAGGEAEGTAGV